MRKLAFGLLLLLAYVPVQSQVTEMNWELDYQLYMKLANDSTYKYDIRDAFHVNNTDQQDFSKEFVFYPVNPGHEYATELSSKSDDSISYKTLWSALHAKLGGGWIHFANCISYAIETRMLDLEEPILKRPQSSWKPDPVTDTWKRTHKWKYYIPIDQKYAIREYKRKKSDHQLGDLDDLPSSYIDLFLHTNNRDYNQLLKNKEFNKIARIDLVKVILGANYLGKAQITFISNAVLNAVKNYSASKLPSILIFDKFDAAAAMTLNVTGYKIEQLAFRKSAHLSQEEIAKRTQEIRQIVKKINNYNQESFKKRLGSYYND